MKDLIFSWRKQLNIKKVIIIVSIIITLIIIFFAYQHNKKQKLLIEEASNPNTVFYDNKKTISVELSKMYGLKKYTPVNDYLIELRSEKNLNIFVSFKENIKEKSLKDIVSADKLAFTQSFEKQSNISEIRELNVNGHSAFTYSFHYLDQNLNIPFYIQIVWLEFKGNYYIFDIEFPLNDLNSYINIVTETLSNFKIDK